MIPDKTVKELINKHITLEKELSLGSIDKKTFAEKSKEYSDLNEIVKEAKKYLSFRNNKLELQKILKDENTDEELKKIAEQSQKFALENLMIEDMMSYLILVLQKYERLQNS